MTRTLRLPVCAAMAALFLTWPSTPAWACSCAVASVSQQVQAASAVFVGVAVEVREEIDGLVARFRVERVYRGMPADRLDVKTSRDAAACGVPFVAERSYAVFVRDEGGALTTNVCLGTTDDVTTLSGVAPTGSAPSSRAAPRNGTAEASRTGSIAIAALLVGLLAAGSALAVRAARRPRPIA